jgi:hypothetical protein
MPKPLLSKNIFAENRKPKTENRIIPSDLEAKRIQIITII